MEIAIRNSIYRQIKKTYGVDWYIGNRLNLDREGSHQVARLIRHYKDSPRCNTPETLSAKIVSELSLGFWSNLFKRQYEDPLWRKTLRFAFPHVGGALTRGQVFEILDRIRRLRNRISHHEQIIKYDLNVYYNNIIDLVLWVSPVTAIWLSHHNRFYEVTDEYREALSLVKP
jgi:hypothetical protein